MEEVGETQAGIKKASIFMKREKLSDRTSSSSLILLTKLDKVRHVRDTKPNRVIEFK